MSPHSYGRWTDPRAPSDVFEPLQGSGIGCRRHTRPPDPGPPGRPGAACPAGDGGDPAADRGRRINFILFYMYHNMHTRIELRKSTQLKHFMH